MLLKYHFLSSSLITAWHNFLTETPNFWFLRVLFFSHLLETLMLSEVFSNFAFGKQTSMQLPDGFLRLCFWKYNGWADC
jgi:hypothetical protein